MEQATNFVADTAPTNAPATAPAMEAAGMLTTDQAAEFLGIKKSYLYKLTRLNVIPFYRPFGRKIYFDKHELEKSLKRNRIATAEEIEEEAERIMSRRMARSI